MWRAWLIALLLASATFGVVGGSAGAEGSDGPCCVGGQVDAGASGEGGSSPSVTSWVIGAPGGGISRPPGAPTCTGWSPAANIDPETRPSDLGTVKVDPDGVTAILYYRDCGERRQFVWIRQEPPEVIAALALDDIRTRLLDQPDPDPSPRTRGFVNLETWLAVDDPGEQTVTASIPGLSVTATARVASTTWTFHHHHHHHHDDAPAEVICDGLGVPWSPDADDHPAPCGHTFTRPTTPDTPLTIEVTVTWEITWAASNGTNGTLDPITSAAAQLTYPIDEIQTIGTRG